MMMTNTEYNNEFDNVEYEAPEAGPIEMYLEEARAHPKHLHAIIAAAVYDAGHSVKPFVDEFKFDVNTHIVRICDGGVLHPVISAALKYMNVEEIEYLLSAGATLPSDALDWMFNGKNSYYTWGDIDASEMRARDINKIIDMVGMDTLSKLDCAEWWRGDFMDHVRECDGKHPYLEYDNIRALIGTDDVSDDEEY